MKSKFNYKHTIAASYIGYITQALVNNFSPLLFVTFHNEFNISLSKVGLIITVNFFIQLLIDILSSVALPLIGYRKAAVTAHLSAGTGFILLGTLPYLTKDPFTGILIATFFSAVGGGLCEVIISPIVEACPTDKKSAAMSLLHSFYCWGQLAVTVLSTAFFFKLGIGNWKSLSFIWSVIPFVNALYFMLVPIYEIEEPESGNPLGNLLRNKLFYILFLLMVCSGASELSMSQWASAFAEVGLKVNKSTGDLLGPAMFAVLMGVSRVFYAKFSEKLNLKRFLLFSSFLCVISYLTAAFSPNPLLSLVGCAVCGLSVGIMWPGVISIGACEIRNGGSAMFALLALGGDIGCTGGPTIVNAVSTHFGGNLSAGFAVAALFPLILIFGVFLLRKNKESTNV